MNAPQSAADLKEKSAAFHQKFGIDPGQVLEAFGLRTVSETQHDEELLARLQAATTQEERLNILDSESNPKVNTQVFKAIVDNADSFEELIGLISELVGYDYEDYLYFVEGLMRKASNHANRQEAFVKLNLYNGIPNPLRDKTLEIILDLCESQGERIEVASWTESDTPIEKKAIEAVLENAASPGELLEFLQYKNAIPELKKAIIRSLWLSEPEQEPALT